MLKYFIFVHLLLIEDYEQGDLLKELISTPFVRRFKNFDKFHLCLRQLG